MSRNAPGPQFICTDRECPEHDCEGTLWLGDFDIICNECYVVFLESEPRPVKDVSLTASAQHAKRYVEITGVFTSRDAGKRGSDHFYDYSGRIKMYGAYPYEYGLVEDGDGNESY